MIISLTLNTLGEVPEIEDIMGLSWSGQQIDTHSVVNLYGCIHNLTGAFLHSLGELAKKTA